MTAEETACILADAWRLIGKGVTDRRCAAHHPVVATVDASGRPDQRVMILRAADQQRGVVQFNTDIRSPKVLQIGDSAPAHVLIYEPAAKVQLRLSGSAHIESDGPAAQRAWQQATNFARRCYLAEQGPGTVMAEGTSGLPGWAEGIQPSDAQIIPARANFAVLQMELQSLDWLHLANSGHRRARISRDGGQWIGQWLQP